MLISPEDRAILNQLKTQYDNAVGTHIPGLQRTPLGSCLLYHYDNHLAQCVLDIADRYATLDELRLLPDNWQDELKVYLAQGVSPAQLIREVVVFLRGLVVPTIDYYCAEAIVTGRNHARAFGGRSAEYLVAPVIKEVLSFLNQVAPPIQLRQAMESGDWGQMVRLFTQGDGELAFHRRIRPAGARPFPSSELKKGWEPLDRATHAPTFSVESADESANPDPLSIYGYWLSGARPFCLPESVLPAAPNKTSDTIDPEFDPIQGAMEQLSIQIAAATRTEYFAGSETDAWGNPLTGVLNFDGDEN